MKEFLEDAYAFVMLRILVVLMGLIIITSGLIAPEWTFTNLIKD
jgi:hypothetical protein